MATTKQNLEKILGLVFRFPHNVRLEDIVDEVYGVTSTNGPYRKGKVDLILRKGFTWWYCELDLSNQAVVCGLILARYPELYNLIFADPPDLGPEPGMSEQEVNEFLDTANKRPWGV